MGSVDDAKSSEVGTGMPPITHVYHDLEQNQSQPIQN